MIKFKKYATLALASVTLFSVGAGAGATVQASSWHSGVPSVLKGTWNAKIVVKGGYKSGTGKTTIKSNSIEQAHRFAPVDPQNATNLKYKYNGNGSYSVSSTAYNQGMKFHKTFKFKVYSKDKIYFSGFRSGKYGDSAVYYRG